MDAQKFRLSFGRGTAMFENVRRQVVKRKIEVGMFVKMLVGLVWTLRFSFHKNEGA